MERPYHVPDDCEHQPGEEVGGEQVEESPGPGELDGGYEEVFDCPEIPPSDPESRLSYPYRENCFLTCLLVLIFPCLVTTLATTLVSSSTLVRSDLQTAQSQHYLPLSLTCIVHRNTFSGNIIYPDVRK